MRADIPQDPGQPDPFIPCPAIPTPTPRPSPHPQQDRPHQSFFPSPTSPFVDMALVQHDTMPLPTLKHQQPDQRTQSIHLPPWMRHLSVLIAILAITVISISALAPLAPGRQPSGLFQDMASVLSQPATPPSPNSQIPCLRAPRGTVIPPFPGPLIWLTNAGYYTASCAVGTGHMIDPVPNAHISLPFGVWEWQPWTGGWMRHNGVDLAAPLGSPIYAADSGQVIWAGWDTGGLGNSIKINHGRGFSTMYGHMLRFVVHVGENVARGQLIGYVGMTGQATGPHCHFMVLINNNPVNPATYVPLP